MTHRSLLQLFLEISWLSAALMPPIVTGSPHPTLNALLSKYRLIVSILDSHYCQSLTVQTGTRYSCPLSSAIWNYSESKGRHDLLPGMELLLTDEKGLWPIDNNNTHRSFYSELGERSQCTVCCYHRATRWFERSAITVQSKYHPLGTQVV